jgi:hypothetical protein
MILGLCGSFAVVPALSLVGSGSRANRHLADRAHQPGDAVDPSLPASVGVGALILSDATLSGSVPSGAMSIAAAQSDAAASAAAAWAALSAVPASGGLAAVAAPVTTPTTRPAPRVLVPVPPVVVPHVTSAAQAVQGGVASWLNTIPTGTCANNGAPMGAVITVTNAVGASITCKVVSRGPFVAGRVVDIAESTFAQLGSVSRGLVGVTVSW